MRLPTLAALLLVLGRLACAPCAAAAAQPASPPGSPAAVLLAANAAELSPPLRLVDGSLVLPPGSPQGTGKAVFHVTIAAEGDYVLTGLARAPRGDANSFFVAFDAAPASPAMIWDLPPSADFVETPVTWRGSWENGNPEFSPKRFHLTAGEHTLIVAGREPDTALRSLVLTRWQTPAPGSLGDIRLREDAANRLLQHELDPLPDTPEGQARARQLWQAADKACSDLYVEAVKLAERSRDPAEAFQALDWVLGIVRTHYLPAGPEAFRLMAARYAADPRITHVMTILASWFPSEHSPSYAPAMDLLRKVEATNTSRRVLALCAIIRAEKLKEEYQGAEGYGSSADIERTAKAAAAAYEAIARDFAGCPYPGRPLADAHRTADDYAHLQLREIRALGVGCLAPELEGADTAGRPMKLGEFRGKVVLLVFWASWCGPCMAEVPHEKELVERFKGRLFVLVGVNGDDTLHDAAKAVARNQIPWRSFWAPANAIPRAWNVRAWPTVIVIDHRGRIVRKNLRGPMLDPTLEQFVSAAEKR